jgi:surface antigen
VVDSQGHPPRDGLDHLFGDSAFDQLIGGTTSVPIRNPSTGELPSRRELRTAPTSRSRAAVKPSRAASKPPKAPKRSRKGEKLSRQAPQAFVQPADSAYPVNRVIVVRRAAPPVRKRSRGRGFLTILAVVGLFGSVAIPAYAFAPNSAGASPDAAGQLATADVSLKTSGDAAVTATTRGEFHATTAFELKNQRRTAFIDANFAAYMLSGAREKGDDYPWFSELSNNQGGGISPLNYFYRECVDFVAWRLNRDAGVTSAPYLWTWSTLTPSGGNAYQWKRAWLNKGWPTSTTPIAGSVAWYSYGHVAYVKSVNGDGTITVEDYNQSGMHIYEQRVVPAGDANLYLYPPPH